MRAVLILLFCAGLAVAAPDRNAATVSGNGVEKIESLPGIMRMTLRLEAKADTLDKALEDMAKQTADVKTRLTALNPVDGKITEIGRAHV